MNEQHLSHFAIHHFQVNCITNSLSAENNAVHNPERELGFWMFSKTTNIY